MKLNKKQKRTATIASMAALLAVVLGMGGQTFAKYITTHEVEAQTAVVAKWGYVIQASTDTESTFKTEYDTTPNGTVKSLGSDKKVAPGTAGSMTIAITGEAEVKSEVNFVFTGTTKDVYLTDGTAYYNPVKWSVEKSGAPVVDGTLADVEAYFENGGAALLTNEATADVDVEYTISWAWAYEGTETINITDPATSAQITVDAADTYLGNYVADETSLPAGWEACVQISFGIEVSVEQLD